MTPQEAQELRVAVGFTDAAIKSGLFVNINVAACIVKAAARLLALHDAGELQRWRPIETAPKNIRVLVWSGLEIYAAHWAKNPFTDDEAWIVAEWGDEGDQVLVKPTHWRPMPPPPQPVSDPDKLQEKNGEGDPNE